MEIFPILLEDNNVDKIVQTRVCLHNYLVEDKPIAQLYAELNPEQRPFMHCNGLLQQSTGFSVMATTEYPTEFIKVWHNIVI